MAFKTIPIPDWYTADWAPATRRHELPPMTWEAVEEVIELLLEDGPARQAARASMRMLWLESSRMAPMTLLQSLLVAAAQAFDPNKARTRRFPASNAIPSSASGPLPRWSFTDLEVALAHTWRGLALTIANRRHHQFLMRRGEPLSPSEVVTVVFLLVAGLPGSHKSIAKPLILKLDLPRAVA